MDNAQREAMKTVRLKQAFSALNALAKNQIYLINGNFSAIAKKYQLPVKELKKYYNENNKG